MATMLITATTSSVDASPKTWTAKPPNFSGKATRKRPSFKDPLVVSSITAAHLELKPSVIVIGLMRRHEWVYDGCAADRSLAELVSGYRDFVRP